MCIKWLIGVLPVAPLANLPSVISANCATGRNIGASSAIGIPTSASGNFWIFFLSLFFSFFFN